MKPEFQSQQKSSAIKAEQHGHVALLTLNNPPANTWTADSLMQLKQIIESLNADRNIYACVITGEGSKFFSAGADLKLFADGNKAVALDMARLFGEAFETLSAFRGVSIAAINGYAMGGGLEVALACDIRIAEKQAVMHCQKLKSDYCLARVVRKTSLGWWVKAGQNVLFYVVNR